MSAGIGGGRDFGGGVGGVDDFDAHDADDVHRRSYRIERRNRRRRGNKKSDDAVVVVGWLLVVEVAVAVEVYLSDCYDGGCDIGSCCDVWQRIAGSLNL